MLTAVPVKTKKGHKMRIGNAGFSKSSQFLCCKTPQSLRGRNALVQLHYEGDCVRHFPNFSFFLWDDL